MGCSASAAEHKLLHARLVHATTKVAWRDNYEDNDESEQKPIHLTEDVTSQEVHVAFDLDTAQHLDKCKDVIIDDERIQKMVAELKPGELFCDPDFPADYSTVCITEDDVFWARPKELVEDPVLLLDGTSHYDIVQGRLDNCTFLSSCAAIARRNDLMERIIPTNQELYGPGHNGLVQFRFWRFGKWVNVYIDDRLPVDEHKNLIYARCSDPREFWVALLEKAYAKLHGSYVFIGCGVPQDCFIDLTGGFAKKYIHDINNPDEIFRHLLRVFCADGFITCSMLGDGKTWYRRSNGLQPSHAYSISFVTEIQLKSGTTEKLIRILNTWANNKEWTGKWSDKSKMWKKVDDKTRAKLHYVQHDDGEFWMSFKDFLKWCDEIFICTLGPDFNENGNVDEAGYVKAIRGCWQLGRSCGGCKNNFIKFATNPQYLLIIHPVEGSVVSRELILDSGNESMPVDHDSPSSSGTHSASNRKSRVLISLMQDRLRLSGKNVNHIGFTLYKAEDPCRRLTLEYLMNNPELSTSTDFKYYDVKEIFESFELEAGLYVIVPATFDPDRPGNFMFRVYADRNFELKELPS